jgi:hypothetical protein
MRLHLVPRLLQACPAPSTYARVDMLRDAAGTLLLMEVELVEPLLWLASAPHAARALAEALVAQLPP